MEDFVVRCDVEHREDLQKELTPLLSRKENSVRSIDIRFEGIELDFRACVKILENAVNRHRYLKSFTLVPITSHERNKNLCHRVWTDIIWGALPQTNYRRVHVTIAYNPMFYYVGPDKDINVIASVQIVAHKSRVPNQTQIDIQRDAEKFYLIRELESVRYLLWDIKNTSRERMELEQHLSFGIQSCADIAARIRKTPPKNWKNVRTDEILPERATEMRRVARAWAFRRYAVALLLDRKFPLSRDMMGIVVRRLRKKDWENVKSDTSKTRAPCKLVCEALAAFQQHHRAHLRNVNDIARIRSNNSLKEAQIEVMKKEIQILQNEIASEERRVIKMDQNAAELLEKKREAKRTLEGLLMHATLTWSLESPLKRRRE